MSRIIMAWCETCDDVVSHSPGATLHHAVCDACHEEHLFESNEALLKKIRDINEELNSMRLRMGFLETKRDVLQHQLVPYVVEIKKDVWASGVRVPCGKCGRQTTWAINGIPRCRDGCGVGRTSRGPRVETLPPDLEALMRQILDAPDDNSDVEVIRK